jgi:hypothetical protein
MSHPAAIDNHALLVLRAVRNGLARLDDRAETLTVDGQAHNLGLYTDDGSVITTALARELAARLGERERP